MIRDEKAKSEEKSVMFIDDMRRNECGVGDGSGVEVKFSSVKIGKWSEAVINEFVREGERFVSAEVITRSSVCM